MINNVGVYKVFMRILKEDAYNAKLGSLLKIINVKV